MRDSGQCVSAAPTAGAGDWYEICAATLGGVLQELPSQAWRFIAAKFNSSCWSFPVRTTCVMRRDWLPYLHTVIPNQTLTVIMTNSDVQLYEALADVNRVKVRWSLAREDSEC